MVDKIGVCVLLREIGKYPGEHLEFSEEEREYLAKLVEEDHFLERRRKIISEVLCE